MSALEHVITEAEKLDRHSQFLLIEKLARQLGETSEHREAWSKESSRRIEAYKRGEIESYDASEVFQQMRSLIRK
jgi:hypothetical protein